MLGSQILQALENNQLENTEAYYNLDICISKLDTYGIPEKDLKHYSWNLFCVTFQNCIHSEISLINITIGYRNCIEEKKLFHHFLDWMLLEKLFIVL